MTSRPKKIRAVDLRLIDDLFEMGGDYVLDFSNQTFAEFFNDELGINIDDARYFVEGKSKAKRLRYFLRSSEASLVVRALLALWEYREAARRRSGTEESHPNAVEEFYSLIERLGRTRPTGEKSTPAPPRPSMHLDPD